MKSAVYIGYLAVFFTMLSCNISDTDKSNDDKTSDAVAISLKTTVKILDSTFNFGKIGEGQKVTFSYRFQNKGKHPLLISSVTADCGCTVAEEPEQPVMPGKTGYVKVAFNSDGIGGIIKKAVYITSNAVPEFPTLILEGEIVSN